MVPAIWIGRLGDEEWIHRLIEAGIGFLMPLPHARSTEALERFASALTVAIDRQLRLRQKILEPSYPSAVCELVDTLLHGADSDTAVGSMLQLASDDFRRGAVLMVEETAIRSRAAFGYPLSRDTTALPRGVGLLEKAIRGGEVILGIDPSAAGAMQLARLLEVDRLYSQTAVIPFGTGASVSGLLVLDREGDPLPDLSDIVLLACCLGGIVTRSCSGSCATGIRLNGSICAP
jgi:hypothetical protein